VTRRAWILAALGLLAIAGTGAFAAASGHSTPNLTPLPHWGLYSDATWDVVATKLERRGFSRASVHLATGTKLMGTGQPFALLGARSDSGRNCFAVARGTALGPTFCHVSKPLVVFTEPDLCAACSPGRSPLKTLTVLSLVRHDVSSVTMVAGGRESGLGISPVDGGNYAFNAGATRNDTVIRARGTGQSILAEIRLRLP
jgi:hypothetical protein